MRECGFRRHGVPARRAAGPPCAVRDHESGHVLGGRIPRQGDADRLAGKRAEPHRRQDVARRHLAGTTGGTGADGDSVKIERDHLRISPHAGKCQARGVGQPSAPPPQTSAPPPSRRPRGIAQRCQRCGGDATAAAAAKPAIAGGEGCRRAGRAPARRRRSAGRSRRSRRKQQGPGARRTAQFVR